MKNIAVILAAGTGQRFGQTVPKQFTIFNGKMLVEYALEAFQQHPDIAETVLVLPANYVTEMQAKLENKHYGKLKHVVAGGAERYLSSYQAVRLYKNEPEANLLIHDAARPLISQEIISEVIQKLQTSKAVMVAMPATDTIALVDETAQVKSVLDRRRCYQVQTPQAFRLSLLRETFQKAIYERYNYATDDCGLVMHYFPHESIAVVTGNMQNVKITTEFDLKFLG
ncbi:MAG: 2-C-methyl-D-erythritol 4-phosphate cytidylyltransferase [Bacteroidales bacterium]|jgi:2-C-methyl-D-erythritol 4-phosphate cytidylyltransferase|nr:2-C-methyl-D-erythritol 4-phosphate cytidylyltransferase [Bacteroidales bacterium]